MTTDAKSLFLGLIKLHRCDLVLDIGSCDGSQSIAFRDALPDAAVGAIEANPHNFRDMQANATLAARNISVHHVAMTDADGSVKFHVAKADYGRPFTADNNRGTSSILDHPALDVTEHVEVVATRLDTFVNANFPAAKSIALWIDVESAEWFVLNGARGIWNRMDVIHVETAHTPMRTGQRCYSEVVALLDEAGLREVGSDIARGENWGNVVFVRKQSPRASAAAIRRAQCVAKFFDLISINAIAVQLKTRCPALYRFGRRLFLKGI